MLALAQAREEHHLPVRKFERVVMGHGIIGVDLPEAGKALPDLLVRQDTDAEGRLAFHILVKSELGAGQQAHRDVRFADRRKPRVMELVNFVVTSLSSSLAGRVATWCKL